jgi:hypothetical protein
LKDISQSDLLRNWVFHFRKTQSLAHEEREEEHPADAAEQERACGAQSAKDLRLNRYGFLTSVAV